MSDFPPQSSALSTQDSSAAHVDPIYTYDLNGNRVSMIDPTGLTTYAYDALNRLTSITNNKGQVTSFTYDALGRRTSMTHANGVVTNYTYDAASQLLSLAHQLGATSINSFAYAYDKVGNRTSKTNRDGAHNYTYDTLNRLTQAINPLPTNPQETYVYDPVGNRTNSNQNGLSVFNSANQLSEDANFTYQYDNNGNTTRRTAKISGAVTTYEYNADNELVRVVSNGRTVNYKYDGLGRRVETEIIDVAAKVTRYVYDNQDILLELDGANNIVARYTHGVGVDEPLLFEKGGQFFFYQADGLGSVTDITDNSGVVKQHYTYSAFGEIESQSDVNFIQSYTFTGREFDSETGLYFFRARHYDPATGRFFQEDPISFAGGDVNFYAYVRNDPILLRDPSGLFVPSVHNNITNSAANAAGCSKIAVRLRKMVALVDWKPESQSIYNAIHHGMCRPRQDQGQGSAEIQRYIESQLKSCELEGLANALHAAQDTFAGGHKGCQPWDGGFLGFPGPIHLVHDSFPSAATTAAAETESVRLINRYRSMCPCPCK